MTSMAGHASLWNIAAEKSDMERQRELSLEGKTVIITGASRGVGKQSEALAFQRLGD